VDNNFPYLNKEERDKFWFEAPPWVKEKMVSFLFKGVLVGFIAGVIFMIMLDI
jgi:hypothetical protein